MSFTDATGNHYLVFRLEVIRKYVEETRTKGPGGTRTRETRCEETIEAEWDLRETKDEDPWGIKRNRLISWLVLYCGSETFRRGDYKPLLKYLGERDDRFSKYSPGEYHVVSAELVRRRDQDLFEILRQTDEYKKAKAENDKALERRLQQESGLQ